MGKSLVGAAYEDDVDVQGVSTTGPILHHWLQCFGQSWLCLSPVAALKRASHAPCSGIIVELALVAGVWVSQPPECGRADSGSWESRAAPSPLCTATRGKS